MVRSLTVNRVVELKGKTDLGEKSEAELKESIGNEGKGQDG